MSNETDELKKEVLILRYLMISFLQKYNLKDQAIEYLSISDDKKSSYSKTHIDSLIKTLKSSANTIPTIIKSVTGTDIL